MNDLLKDRLLAHRRERDGRVLALHPALQKAAFGEVVDVHIFKADMTAIIGVKHRDNLPHRGALEAQCPAEPDGAIEIGFGETVETGGQLGRHLATSQAERVEPGRQMAPHAI